MMCSAYQMEELGGGGGTCSEPRREYHVLSMTFQEIRAPWEIAVRTDKDLKQLVTNSGFAMFRWSETDEAAVAFRSHTRTVRHMDKRHQQKSRQTMYLPERLPFECATYQNCDSAYGQHFFTHTSATSSRPFYMRAVSSASAPHMLASTTVQGSISRGVSGCRL
jgi:hypothetical protein